MLSALVILRYVVFATVAVAMVTAFAVMAVQRRMLNPFGRVARFVRRISDPAIKPIERRVLRSGGNPQQAPWWLLGATLLIGIATISGAEWVAAQVRLLVFANAVAGAGGLMHVVLGWTLGLLKLALIVRVIGSWLGVGQWNAWMRPFYYATEWFLAPLRRVVPQLGPFDISPVIAYLILSLVQSWV